MSPNPDRMHVPDPELVSMMLDYVAARLALPEAPVDGLGDRADLERVVAGLISEQGTDPKTVLDVYVQHLADTILSADSPRYYSFIPAAPTKAALLFDMVVSAASLQGCSWLEAAGIVVAENQALRVLADLAGLPEAAGGTFVSGGSAANLNGLVVARDTARRRRPELRDRRLRVVVSDQAHSSIKNALGILDMGALVVPTADGRMTEADLRAALDEDPSLDDVVAVVATAGTTNAGIVDELTGVGLVAAERDWWFHVDGAYGAAGLLAPSVRDRFAGIELADSLVMDPHKWWFAPFDCAAIIYRDPRLAKAVHTQDASYLDVIHTDAEDLNPSDLAYHLTRRARGMALWFSLAVNGLDAYRDAVERGIELAGHAAARIEAAPELELVMAPQLSVVLFRRIDWTLDDYTEWSARLLREQVAFVTPSAWRGEPVARMVFLHPGTTEAMVGEVLDSLIG